MTYCAGIDAGQSSTLAIVGDETGRILGRGRGPAADEVGHGPQSTRLADALGEALARALSDGALDAQAQCDVVVAGISGYDGTVRGHRPELPARQVVLLHDAPVAHAGAFAGGAGVVAIAGTGSVVYASDGTHERTLGGWGYLFGDEGSAFTIAREALASLMHDEDDGADASPAARDACAFFERPTLRAIARGFAAGELSRERIASYAPAALAVPRFRGIAERGAERLGTLVAAAAAQIGCSGVSYEGGMFADAAFLTYFQRCVCRAGLELREPAHDPATGALLLAYRRAGLTVRKIFP